MVAAVSWLVGELLRNRPDVIGLGVELPGHVNGPMGEVIYSPLWRDRNVPLRQILQDATGLRTVVENDANALAIQEQWFGGNAARDFAVVLLPEGGGIGSALVAENRIVHGREGAAGELGHIRYERKGVRCDCDKRGGLETVASIDAILSKVRQKGPAADLTAAVALADENPAIQHVFKRAGEALGWGISLLLNIVDSEYVLVFAPASLMRQDSSTAKRYMSAVMAASKGDAFSTAAEAGLVWRPLPGRPVLPYDRRALPREDGRRAVPREGASAASAALIASLVPAASVG